MASDMESEYEYSDDDDGGYAYESGDDDDDAEMQWNASVENPNAAPMSLNNSTKSAASVGIAGGEISYCA